MLRRPVIATALAIIALIIVLLLVSLVQEHKHLRSVQEELGRTNQQVVKLEKVIGSLKADLDAAQSQLKEKEAHEQELTTELEKTKKETYSQLAAAKEAHQRQFEAITNEATKKLSESEKRVADLAEQLNSLSAERDTTQSKLSDTQSELEKAKETTQQTNAKLEATEDELEKAKEATEQANARATEFESAGANTAKDAEAERSKLQAALDQANAEIERLKGELEKQKSTPPEQGESVSPAPGERRL